MSIYTETRIISLNSENANRYKNATYLSDVVFGFSGLLKDDPDIIQRQLTLVNAQLPVSFYIVNYTNNVFVFITYPLGVPTNTTITIPVGNYNSTTLISALYYAILPTGIAMLITISKLTGLLTFSATTTYGFNSTSALTTANQILGLSGTSNLVASLVGGNYVATSPFPLNLLGIKQLQIKCSTISCNNYSSNANGQDSLLATVPVSVGAWGLIIYESSAGNDITFHNLTLDDFDIRIVDAETGKPVNFNGIGWTMTILLHITRQINLGVNEKDIKKITNPISLNLPPLAKKIEQPQNEELNILES